jgi:hypothetical protein
MVLKEGWLDRQFDQVSKNVESWPEWMRRAAGFGAADERDNAANNSPKKDSAREQQVLNLK